MEFVEKVAKISMDKNYSIFKNLLGLRIIKNNDNDLNM